MKTIKQLEKEVASNAWLFGCYSPEHNQSVKALLKAEQLAKAKYEVNTYNTINELFGAK